eukprot:CAMPEP_0173328322 /NCGR_PEP_ID=MMETSP1144-20121109/2098_1 /TAXON_ID=483371 /ORGANISM="non described non described, Strain CCMP2298" /LENGTH=118 /DNA_ID=CAMNT_0014272813 /DNA_START=267 /DNA_END=623 /DNA_ORIENTATION=-
MGEHHYEPPVMHGLHDSVTQRRQIDNKTELPRRYVRISGDLQRAQLHILYFHPHPIVCVCVHILSFANREVQDFDTVRAVGSREEPQACVYLAFVEKVGSAIRAYGRQEGRQGLQLYA